MLSVAGHYGVQLIRNNKIIESREGHNSITYEGLKHIVNLFFRRQATLTAAYAPITADYANGWYCGLIREKADLSATNPVPTDTGQSHSFEIFTDFSEDPLPQWQPPLASLDQSGFLKNTDAMRFNITGTPPALLGMYIKQTHEPMSFTKFDGTNTHYGVLWAAALFGAPMEVIAGDIVDVYYKVKINMEGA